MYKHYTPDEWRMLVKLDYFNLSVEFNRNCREMDDMTENSTRRRPVYVMSTIEKLIAIDSLFDVFSQMPYSMWHVDGRAWIDLFNDREKFDATSLETMDNRIRQNVTQLVTKSPDGKTDCPPHLIPILSFIVKRGMYDTYPNTYLWQMIQDASLHSGHIFLISLVRAILHYAPTFDISKLFYFTYCSTNSSHVSDNELYSNSKEIQLDLIRLVMEEFPDYSYLMDTIRAIVTPKYSASGNDW
jgi:hypothetical protein